MFIPAGGALYLAGFRQIMISGTAKRAFMIRPQLQGCNKGLSAKSYEASDFVSPVMLIIVVKMRVGSECYGTSEQPGIIIFLLGVVEKTLRAKLGPLRIGFARWEALAAR